jgi:hypothetical protein
MSDRYTEKTGQPTERPGASTQDPAEILAELRREFLPMTQRLTPEIEPAIVFRVEPCGKETGS